MHTHRRPGFPKPVARTATLACTCMPLHNHTHAPDMGTKDRPGACFTAAHLQCTIRQCRVPAPAPAACALTTLAIGQQRPALGRPAACGMSLRGSAGKGPGLAATRVLRSARGVVRRPGCCSAIGRRAPCALAPSCISGAQLMEPRGRPKPNAARPHPGGAPTRKAGGAGRQGRGAASCAFADTAAFQPAPRLAHLLLRWAELVGQRHGGAWAWSSPRLQRGLPVAWLAGLHTRGTLSRAAPGGHGRGLIRFAKIFSAHVRTPAASLPHST